MNRTFYRRAVLWAVLAALLAGLWVCALAEEDGALYIENQWNYVDGSIDPSEGIPEIVEGVFERILRAGVLRVATEPYFPPQEFIDPSLSGQDSYVGSDMQLARRIAERMGVALEIVPMEFSEVLDAVASGECDLAISALAYTPGRAAAVELSKGYYYSADSAGSGLLIRKKDVGRITGVGSLERRNIVAQSGSLQETLMAENVQRYLQFMRVSSIQDVYQALENGTADAATVDIETALAYIQNNPGCGLALVSGVSFPLDEQYEGDRVAARKGELQLMYFVNGVIDQVLESGEYKQWFEEYEAIAGKLGL